MADTTRNSRITAYKNIGQGTNDHRRKRAELSVALRKQARDEQLLKRRAMSPEAADMELLDKLPSHAEIVEGLKSDILSVKLNATRSARRILSREKNPPISQMVEAGVIKPLIEALDRDDSVDLQFEAAWALTNIASGTHEHTMAVVASGAIPRLVSLAGRGGAVAEQCIWALGNVAGDGPAPRDSVLRAAALPALLPALGPSAPPPLMRTAVWTFSNLCRNKNPMVDFDMVAPGLPYIAALLDINDQEVLADACWAISYLTDGPDERIEAVQAVPNLLSSLTALLGHSSPSVKTPALRAVGNMLTGVDVQTDRCIKAGCLPHIGVLLRCGKPSLIKEAAWAVSNIFAGTQQQIQQVIDTGMLGKLVEVLQKEEIKCQKEAAWAITNLCLGGSPKQLDMLLSAGFLEPYCNLLDSTDPRAVIVVLDGITNLMQAAEKYGQVEALCLKIEEIGALDRIEGLQRHANEEIYKKSLFLLDSYFGAEPEDVEAQPARNEHEYQFGLNTDNRDINF